MQLRGGSREYGFKESYKIYISYIYVCCREVENGPVRIFFSKFVDFCCALWKLRSKSSEMRFCSAHIWRAFRARWRILFFRVKKGLFLRG